MYSTTDGRVMYVTPLVSARIKALQLQQGECFFICKRKNGRLSEFSVFRELEEAPVSNGSFGGHKKTFPPQKSNLPERLYYRADEPSPAAAPPEPPSELERKLADSIALVEQRKQAQRAPVATQQPEWAAYLVAQSNALIDAYSQVVKHASQYENVRGDDVRSIFLSAFINVSKSSNGGRNAA